MLQMLENASGKPFVSVASEDALPVTDAEKSAAEQAEKDHKEMLDFVQEMYLSGETVQYDNLRIPALTLLKGVTVTGIES